MQWLFIFLFSILVLALYLIWERKNLFPKEGVQDDANELEVFAKKTLSAAEKEVQNSDLKKLVVAVSFDGTKGFSQSFVQKIISVLIEKGIEAQYQFSPGSLGMDSGGFIMNILVPPEDLDAAKEIIAVEVAK